MQYFFYRAYLRQKDAIFFLIFAIFIFTMITHSCSVEAAPLHRQLTHWPGKWLFFVRILGMFHKFMLLIWRAAWPPRDLLSIRVVQYLWSTVAMGRMVIITIKGDGTPHEWEKIDTSVLFSLLPAWVPPTTISIWTITFKRRSWDIYIQSNISWTSPWYFIFHLDFTKVVNPTSVGMSALQQRCKLTHRHLYRKT